MDNMNKDASLSHSEFYEILDLLAIGKIIAGICAPKMYLTN